MNPDIKTEVKLPTINWDKILKYSAISIVVVTAIAFISRARSILIVAEIIDVSIILFLIGLGTFALIAKSLKNTNRPKKS